MRNKRMGEKLETGRAFDVSHCPRTVDGDYLLGTYFEEGVDYCDRKNEKWVWSIGEALGDSAVKMATGETRILRKGEKIASLSGKFYEAPGWKCVWLR